MALVNCVDSARAAASEHRGLGAFNVVLLEHAHAFVQAAEQTGLPVVLQLSQNAIKYYGNHLRPIGAALLELAKSTDADVAVHLDHAEDLDLCRAAVDMGFTSIMYDGSKLPDEENRAATREIVEYAHAHGVGVEAELGEVGGKNGVHDPSARTDPHDAAQFVADTGVDLLAVAVGSSHAMSERTAVLDDDLIAAIKSQVDVPLVLHGSSGVPDAGMQAAIAAGMTKINVSTHLNVTFTQVLRNVLEDKPALVDPRKYNGPATEAVEQEVERLLRLYQA
ncbi:class II fructose-bisphosphate aldolase [Gleimia hominis]|uniref:class II fructose-bisphosphate aldolase n=1 Tax=Gleimia hominis TaxID=595468 RepID=UPI000C800352|nr:class II fructose-bisphosphate aldolase [Gleimia hominis]WIK64950.1 class II fructose-bisphosphate aldolase [Gleimia hominis]